MNEKDLHYNIIKFIKNIIDEPIIIAGLGEHQTTSAIRCDAFNKGYQSGQPDILLLNQYLSQNKSLDNFWQKRQK